MTSFSLNPLAVQNAALLRELNLPRDQRAENTKALAARLGRDDSNLGKTIKLLVAEGLAIANPLASGAETTTLTVGGAEQLAAIGRAEHGGEKRRPRGFWPLDKIRPNPANRVIDPDSLPGLADSIEAAGEVLQPALLTPPDASGVRTLLAGERRWRALTVLRAEGRGEEIEARGLPFVEKDADAATALLITLIENGQREDLTPLEDAEQLAALAKATGWSAREIAKKTGRSPQDSDTGVRDVQAKIKIAREASDEAKAEYRRTRSWDALKASVTAAKAEAETYVRPRNVGLAIPPADGTGESTEPTPVQLTARDFGVPEGWRAHGRDISAEHGRQRAKDQLEPGTLETIDLAHRKGQQDYGFPRARLSVARLRDSDGWVCSYGYSLANIGHHSTLDGIYSDETLAFSSRDAALAHAACDMREGLNRNLKAGVPADVEKWLAGIVGWESPAPAENDPLVVNGQRYPNLTRANEARRLSGLVPNSANHGGGSAKAKPTPEPEGLAHTPSAPRPEAPAADPRGDEEVEEGRNHNDRIADLALLAKIEAFVSDEASRPSAYALDLLAAVGISGPFSAGEDAGVQAWSGDAFAEVATVDVNCTWPKERAQALALLIAWALQRTFGEAA